MGFVIRGIESAPFESLFGLADAALAEEGVVRMTAGIKPGFPCRVTLEDAEPGETLLLVNYEHQPANTPYRSRHAIFVRERSASLAEFIDEVPESLASRLLSLRAFDEAGMMVDAACLDGSSLREAIAAMFDDDRVAYLHAHNARRGCFAARIDRHVSGTCSEAKRL